ncbi:MAG: hypothetical protein Q7U52_02430 [Hydrogenophaga sp.]|uniref:hypothetical protein n=1 Tax=Hydrogenophaga sp. TaxID=1904254 RepID=UPI0027172E08|nr:hypothetical protein [Hydrogenophaga sp.]MDO9146525.1 hypothetical protein [Hydrogenophaga sp.]MDO9603602.1 hypothetical protein [Hydrogenophaga sp.]
MNMTMLTTAALTLRVKALQTRLSRLGGALAALLLLAGSGQRRRRALPAHRLTAHSGPSNCSF